MDFNYNDNQQMLRDTVDRFLTDKYDLPTRHKLLSNPEGETALWREMAELGLIGAAFPEEVGGYAASSIDAMVVMERFGRHLVTLPYLTTAIVCGRLLIVGGRSHLIERVIAGEARLALAAGSTHALRSAEDHSFTATANGDGWTISGRMPVVIGGDSADYLIVAARTSEKLGDLHGVTLFLVDADKVARRSFRMIDAHGAAEVVIDALTVGADAVLGDVGGGVPLVELALDHGIAAACGEAIGSMGHLVPATVEYTRTREQYGAPLAKFQVLQHRMADMYIQTETARSMAYVASMSLDGDASERTRITSAAKAQIGKSAKFVGYQAVQLHGGMGVSEELDIGHHYIRLTTLNQLFGDTAFHLRRFAAAGARP
ncbi:MAG: pimeloyl-CoA dehydrogenase small subunit [Alphaproteobacteria bacterium HGW-Alphaproteobacteria-16]|nr:MAG: pimeloyl-CoA dehydrogenase small subunit [Alphaproteobacteria bacterium HGW-Alphaproteobacteria-16]